MRLKTAEEKRAFLASQIKRKSASSVSHAVLCLEVLGPFEDFSRRVSRNQPGVTLDSLREFSLAEENNENAKMARGFYAKPGRRDVAHIIQVSFGRESPHLPCRR